MIDVTPTLVAPLVTEVPTLLQVGPPGGLPSPVPDFVSNLLDTIGAFLGGPVDSLGEAVRAVALGGPESAGGPPDAPGR